MTSQRTTKARYTVGLLRGPCNDDQHLPVSYFINRIYNFAAQATPWRFDLMISRNIKFPTSPAFKCSINKLHLNDSAMSSNIMYVRILCSSVLNYGHALTFVF